MNLPPECMQKGHPDYGGGRPRSVVPEYDELIELGKDLVEWSKDENSWRYAEWYTKKGYISSDWDKMLIKPEFRVYYETARANMARRYIDGTINPSIAHRFIRIYCPEVKRDEEDKVRFEAMTAKEAVEGNVDAIIAEQQGALMAQIASLQEALKAARTKQSNDK